jgi:hypothetical protein
MAGDDNRLGWKIANGGKKISPEPIPYGWKAQLVP